MKTEEISKLEKASSPFMEFQSQIQKMCFIEYGVITKLQWADKSEKEWNGFVEVVTNAGKDGGDIRKIACRVLSFCSAGISVRVLPKINDRVIVFSPRKFNDDMFLIDKKQINYGEFVGGYNTFSCFCILANYKQDGNKNFIDIDDKGNFVAKFIYQKDGSDKELIIEHKEGGVCIGNAECDMSINPSGAVIIKNQKNGEVSIDKDGQIETMTQNSSILQDKNGNITIKNNSCKVEMSSSSVKINNHLEVSV